MDFFRTVNYANFGDTSPYQKNVYTQWSFGTYNINMQFILYKNIYKQNSDTRLVF